MVQWGYDQDMSENIPLSTIDWSKDIVDYACRVEGGGKMAAKEEDDRE